MTEKEKVFNKIATEEAQRQGDNIGNFEYYSYYLCPDQYVGIIKNVTKKKRFWRKKLDDFDCREIPIFILLQESPHQDEYEYAENVSERISIGPSNGETGIKIWKYLKKKLGKDYEQYKDFCLILMNPVQHQCSLGRETKYCRTRIFNKVFDKNDLINRIKNICKVAKTVVILPAPTSVVKKKIEKCLNELKIENLEKILPTVSHPSAWK